MSVQPAYICGCLVPMINLITDKLRRSTQIWISVLLVIAVAGGCYALEPLMGYRVVALVLLLTVSLVAISFDILPVLIAATLSAFIWNYFFIPPRFTFHVQMAEDLLLFIMYFVIAIINAALTYKIRQVKKISRQKEERANTLKLYDTLLHSLSHELRTPIATIISATDNLAMHDDLPAGPGNKQLVAEISKAAFRLNQQVENLLNMSRLESGFIQPKKDWCDINELVYNTIRKIEDHKAYRKLSININPNLPLVKTDKLLLEQIIMNLVSNAFLHTVNTTPISIRAAIYVNVLQVVVEDEGPGFPPAEIVNVFDKFYRLNNAKAGGTGLGLSIVRGFTEILGGTVNLRNRLPQGAQFTVEIPCEVSKLKM